MRTYFYPLDAMRFCAALSVMVFHLGFYGWASGASSLTPMLDHATAYPELTPWAWFGWVGVEIFFVISGFVIANSANGVAPIRFAKSRFLRLYPAVLVCAPITLAAWMAIDGQTWQAMDGTFFRSLLLWLQGPWIDGVYWSLAVEIVFYALILLVLLFGGFKHLTRVAWGLLLYAAAFTVLNAAFGDALRTFALWRWAFDNADPLLLRYGCFFALGIWMWRCSARAMRRSDWAGVAVAIVCCCLEMIERTAILAENMREAGVILPTIGALLPIALWLTATAFMFAFARYPDRFAPRTARTQGALKQIGTMTYPLYLVHSVVGVGVIRALVERGTDRWLALAAAMCVGLALSYMVARVAEPGVRRVFAAGWARIEASLLRRPLFAFVFRSGGEAA